MNPHQTDENMMRRRYDRFRQCVSTNDFNAAAEEFSRLCHWLRRSDLKLSPRIMAAFSEAWVELFWQARDHEAMIQVADDAIKAYGPSPEWSFARGEALFNLCRFDEAEQELAPLTTEDFDDPMVFYLLACIAERKKKREDAARLFEAANRLDPQNFLLPQPISEGETLSFFRQCLSELPVTIAAQVENLPIYVSELPSDSLLLSGDEPMDPLVMGLFMGQPIGEASSPWPSDQPVILLFTSNIAKIAGDLAALEDELRKTLFHEIGHYLGFDEDQLEDMGLG